MEIIDLASLALGTWVFIYLACQLFGCLVAAFFAVFDDDHGWWSEIGNLKAEKVLDILPWIFLPVVGPVVFLKEVRRLSVDR